MTTFPKLILTVVITYLNDCIRLYLLFALQCKIVIDRIILYNSNYISFVMYFIPQTKYIEEQLNTKCFFQSIKPFNY